VRALPDRPSHGCWISWKATSRISLARS
jgi:hypothetical protein